MTDNPFIRKLFQLGFLIKRPMTLGVRIIAQNEQEQVLLVKHTYVSGWYLPGGGVERGETVEQATHKELMEETGFKSQSELELFGVYHNRSASRRDHIVVFTCNNLECVTVFEPNREIAEIGFFDVYGLPNDISGGSKRRLDEYFTHKKKSQHW